jgi:regulatory protein
MDEPKAYAYALRLLARMDYPSGKLAEKMKARGASNATIDSTLGKLEKLGYVNDEDYIRRFAEEKSRQGYGRRWIEASLRKKLLSVELIRQALGDAGNEEEETAALKALGSLGKSRWRLKKNEEPRKRAGRLFAFLVRRGFGAAAAQAAVRQVLQVDPEE